MQIRHSIITILFAIFGLLCVTPIVSYAADCSSPNFPEGSLEYFSTSGKVFKYCDGSSWSSLGGATTLDGLTDVNVSSPQDGLPLVYDSASGNWVQGACDATPDGLNFPDKTDMAQSVLTTSNIALISGVTCATATVTITGDGTPEYQICSDNNCSTVVQSWGVANSVISSGQYIQLRLTTSGSLDTTFTATLNVGGTNYTWNVKTIGPKKVFLTSTTYDGNLGGLSGADSKCQARADAVGLPGTFKAWLSDSTTNAADRLSHSTVNYVLTNGTVVANGWTDLTDGSLDSALCRDENGNMIAACGSNWQVWSNTNSNGSKLASSQGSWCLGWTSNQGGETANWGGQTGATDGSWTYGTTSMHTCDNVKRLYCLEQEAGGGAQGGSGPGQGGGSAAGNQGEIQFNSGNYLATDPNFVFTSTGRLGLGTASPNVALHVVGDINYTGQIVDVSDIRLKENIRPLQSPLDKLTSINGFSFQMKGDPKHATEYGVSAQDVQKVFPELVSPVSQNGTLGVNYSGLIAPMIEAIKEQQAQIEALKAEIEFLKSDRADKSAEQ